MACEWIDEMDRLEVASEAQHEAVWLLNDFRHQGVVAEVLDVGPHRGAGVRVVLLLEQVHQVVAHLRPDGRIDEYRINARRPVPLHLDDPDRATAVYATRQLCGLVGDR
jgi:hypothetical protein